MSNIFVACRIPQGLNICGVEIIGSNKAAQFEAAGIKGRSLAGFGVTEVDKDEWFRWLKGHYDSEIIKQNMLIAHEDRQQLYIQCRREMMRRRGTGFEQGVAAKGVM